MRGLRHAHRCQLFARTATQALLAQPSQVLFAGVGQTGKFRNRPVARQVVAYRIPYVHQSWLALPGLNHTRHVALDHVDPYRAGTRVGRTLHFGGQPQDCVLKAMAVEPRHAGRHGSVD